MEDDNTKVMYAYFIHKLNVLYNNNINLLNFSLYPQFLHIFERDLAQKLTNIKIPTKIQKIITSHPENADDIKCPLNGEK